MINRDLKQSTVTATSSTFGRYQFSLVSSYRTIAISMRANIDMAWRALGLFKLGIMFATENGISAKL